MKTLMVPLFVLVLLAVAQADKPDKPRTETTAGVPARTSGTTTPFTSRLRFSTVSDGCCGTTVEEVAWSRSGWRYTRARN